jgi:arabinose-5-phosphate isomerase
MDIGIASLDPGQRTLHLGPLYSPDMDRSPSEKEAQWIQSALQILDDEAKALAGLRGRIGAEFAGVVSRILEMKGRVVLTGMGKAGLIAQKISATLASTGTPSIYLHPAEAVHGDLGRVMEGDLLFALSKSGETEEVLRLLPIVKASGVPVLAMTESRKSTLGQISDIILEIGKIDEAGPHGLAPSASTLVMLALGDAVALVVQEGRNFGPEDFARFHPSGALGRQLMKVSELMGGGEELPAITADRSVVDALVTMTETPGKRGAVVVVDQEGKLCGIFTDGDLRRCLQQKRQDFFQAVIGDVMTEHPKSIQKHRLAAEAFRILQKNQIDQLPVVDAEGHAVGLIDVQDLWDFRLA